MIIINSKYRINNDMNSWTVEENKPVKDEKSENYGKDNWVAITYHSRCNSALEKILDLRLKDIPECDIKEFLNQAKIIRKELIALLTTL